jgi:hypothetical protein
MPSVPQEPVAGIKVELAPFAHTTGGALSSA